MKLFVYGTLKSTSTMPGLLKGQGAVYASTASTVGKHIMYLDFYYPCLVESTKEHGHIIKGELWDVSENTSDILEYLDWYEGAPVLFHRGTIVVDSGNGPETALCYYKTDPEVPEDEFDHISEY